MTFCPVDAPAQERQCTGKQDNLIPLLVETLKVTKAKLGRDGPDTIRAMDDLGRSRQLAGQCGKATPVGNRCGNIERRGRARRRRFPRQRTTRRSRAASRFNQAGFQHRPGDLLARERASPDTRITRFPCARRSHRPRGVGPTRAILDSGEASRERESRTTSRAVLRPEVRSRPVGGTEQAALHAASHKQSSVSEDLAARIDARLAKCKAAYGKHAKKDRPSRTALHQRRSCGRCAGIAKSPCGSAAAASTSSA